MTIGAVDLRDVDWVLTNRITEWHWEHYLCSTTRQEAFAWSSAWPRLGCRSPLPDGWLVGATYPLSGPAPAMPPLPVSGWGGMAVLRQCTPSVSCGCPSAAPLVIAACRTPARVWVRLSLRQQCSLSHRS